MRLRASISPCSCIEAGRRLIWWVSASENVILTSLNFFDFASALKPMLKLATKKKTIKAVLFITTSYAQCSLIGKKRQDFSRKTENFKNFRQTHFKLIRDENKPRHRL